MLSIASVLWVKFGNNSALLGAHTTKAFDIIDLVCRTTGVFEGKTCKPELTLIKDFSKSLIDF